jgi:uncharacterized lipoprotein YmbA
MKARVAVVVAAAAIVAGCAASRPPERFHTLLPADPPGTPPPAADRIHVDLGPVSVPAQVDHAQWVVRRADDSLLLLEQERWAAPLPDELRTAIVDRLTRRWMVLDVRGVGLPASQGWRLRVDVQRFESEPGVAARLEAIWAVSPPGGAPALVCRNAWVEPVPQLDALALAAAHRRAVMRLADEIGERLRSLRAGKPAQC